jgi:adenylosuccinate lyase
LCEQAAREGRQLLEVMRSDPQAMKLLSEEELGALFDPRQHFGAARPMIERVLSHWASARESAA